MRVALVHDWLTGTRGGEKVLAELAAMFPDAPIHTLVRRPGSVPAVEDGRPIVTSLLQRVPFGATHHQVFLPLYPLLVRTLVVAEPVDLVVSSSHAVAKAVRVPVGARHVCYCHAPMRYVWDDRGEYTAHGRWRWARRAALALVRGPLRRWDRRTSAGVDRFVANSAYVRDRIRSAYDRDAEVVHPPVDTTFFTPSDVARGDAALVVSALVPYKRIDLAVRAFTTAERPLVVVGDGTERRALERIAGPTIRFLGTVPDERLRELYRTSRVLVFPGVEDFGIVPVEAQACGLPVVAYAEGGAVETVVDGETGVLFTDRSARGFIAAVDRALGIRWNVDVMTRHAGRFSAERFRTGMRAILEI